jgi:hypothetical protein
VVTLDSSRLAGLVERLERIALDLARPGRDHGDLHAFGFERLRHVLVHGVDADRADGAGWRHHDLVGGALAIQ